MGIETVQDSRLEVAMPSIAEKGYSDVILTLSTQGGHSSLPPDHTGIGMLGSILSFLESHPHQPSLSPRNPVLTHLICLADALDRNEKKSSSTTSKGREDWSLFSSREDKFCQDLNSPESNLDLNSPTEGFKMTRRMRKHLRNPSKWNSVAKEIAETGTRAERFIIQTSQAIDIIGGGVKANALPEKVTALINHRINVDSSVTEIHERLEKLVKKASKKFGIKVVGFGKEDVTDEMIGKDGLNGILRVSFSDYEALSLEHELTFLSALFDLILRLSAESWKNLRANANLVYHFASIFSSGFDYQSYLPTFNHV